jgi:hypothetical protein
MYYGQGTLRNKAGLKWVVLMLREEQACDARKTNAMEN